MVDSLKIALAQLNFHIGSLEENYAKHLAAAIKARDVLQADVIVFPELSLCGYPADDLLLRPSFIKQTLLTLERIQQEVHGIYCLVGHPKPHAHGLYNACSILYNGRIIGCYTKHYLPNYGVFDESRYFTPGTATCVIPIKNKNVGIVICEDIWHVKPIQAAKAAGAELILSPNASPFEINKQQRRMEILKQRCQENHLPIIYVNHCSAHEELVFDGGSMAVHCDGSVSECAGFFQEKLLSVHLDNHYYKTTAKQHLLSLPSEKESIYQALVLSIRDYFEKNNFPSILLGLSGGIDSALVLCLAIDAIGPERIHTLMLPSRYTASMSIEDAKAMAHMNQVAFEIISIEPLYQAFLDNLTPHFKNKTPDITEENLQARIRASIIMAFSNKFGHLVLTTGNRSEMAVGYCTLYGDMAGGFAPLKDIPKTMVYQLANYRNQQQLMIPERILTRPPSAELAFEQKDEDSLPPYPLLDAILEAYLNKNLSQDEIIQQGYVKDLVEKVIRLIQRNEYKRKQAAPGPHIHGNSFGRARRYPISHGFKG